ncbi:MAG: S41 family peptidase, partial [Bacteroidota bacterium]
ISLEPGGDALYFLKRGSLSKHDSKTTSLPHSAKMNIDKPNEREQIFEEAWSALNEGFYDPEFHGKDWEALKKKYKSWALAASTSQDFYYMFNLMLGQLNASHMGLFGGNDEETQRESTGRLGIEVVPEKEGVKVTRIVPYTPADRAKSKLYLNDVINSVNGQEIGENTNFYQLLEGETTEQVLMEVKGTDGKTREVVIRPTRSIRTELYEEWIKEKKELTEKYSNGRLGYIHIRGMNLPSFERFERELMASGLGKEGIVIDVRYNGGGWTTDYLMAVLNVKQHAYTIPRGAAKSLEENKGFSQYYPYSERLPLSAWTKPSIAMCNESSYSNAEIFSHAYKTLGIGTLVGMPTFGAVISTGGQGLIDGSFVRMPFRAWYVKATGENMENGPAVPDVIIDNPPASRAKGEDAQLRKSVELLLQQIDSN